MSIGNKFADFMVIAVVIAFSLSCDDGPTDDVILNGPWDFYHLKLERYAQQKSIYFFKTDSGWACSGRYILFFDGDKWSIAADLYESRSGNYRPEIWSLDFLTETDGWAVASDYDSHNGLVFHYDGVGWKYAATTSETRLFAVDAVAPYDVWAAGETSIWHYDGASWSLVADVGITIWGLYFRAPDDGWAVGDDGAYFHYDGNAWQGVYADDFENRYDIFFTSADKGWAVGGGSFFAPEAPPHNPLLGYANGMWKPVISGPDKLDGVHFATPGDGWAVGSKIWRYDGSRWQEIPSPGNLYAYDVFTLGGNDVWLACNNGYICKYNPNKQ